MKAVIARWEANKGKRFLDLCLDEYGYSYRGEDCGGVLPALAGDVEAIAHMEKNAVNVLRIDFPSTHRVI